MTKAAVKCKVSFFTIKPKENNMPNFDSRCEETKGSVKKSEEKVIKNYQSSRMTSNNEQME